MGSFRAYILCLIVSMTFGIQAQSFTGIVRDNASKKPLPNAVVMLIRAGDSSLFAFSRARSNGAFSFPPVAKGKYTMVVTFPKYADFVDTLLMGEWDVDYGMADLFSMADMLEKITVYSKKAAIRMNGDTLEYQADSFRVREGSSVEDLLKKLPGVQVNRKGEIIAQGKKVDRVLVDGEEFFGDDPTMATKNLDAKNVDKLQVYDSKSETAKATGVDDGQSIKVMDIKLKENSKKGYLGKVSAGSDFKTLYEGRALVSHFKGLRKMNAYGIASNSPNIGLDWQEQKDFGDENNNYYDAESGYSYNTGSNDDIQYWMNYSEGLPTSLNYGSNYFNKFDSMKYSLSLGFNYKDLRLNAQKTTTTKTVLKENSLNQVNTENNVNFRNNYSAKAKTEIKLDSLKTLTVGFTGKKTGLKTTAENVLSSEYDDGRKVNYQSKKNEISGNNENIEMKLVYNQKMRKKNRYLNITVNTMPGRDNSIIDMLSDNRFYTDSVNFTQQNLNQQKKSTGSSLRNNANIFFNEPLTKFWSLGISLSENHQSALNEKYTYNKNSDGSLSPQFIDSLSSNATFGMANWKQSAFLTFKDKKWKLSGGATVNYLNLTQQEEIRSYNYGQDYLNVFPSFNFSYKYSKVGNLSMNYDVRATAPTAQQVQPIVDNNNPLNLMLGNPELKQSIGHIVAMHFNDNKIMSNRYIYANGNFMVYKNGINNSSSLDSAGRTSRKSINTDGNWSFSGMLFYNKSIKKTPLSFNINYQPGIFRNNSEFNGKIISTLSQYHKISVGLDLELDDILEFSAEMEHTQNISRSSIQTEFSNNNWQQSINLDLDLILPKDYEISITCIINRRQKTDIYTNNVNNTLINSQISKRFLKSKKLRLEAGVNDLLNQNFGYQRSVYNNVISENQFNTFTRFFYGKITWRFNTAGTKTPGS